MLADIKALQAENESLRKKNNDLATDVVVGQEHVAQLKKEVDQLKEARIAMSIL